MLYFKALEPAGKLTGKAGCCTTVLTGADPSTLVACRGSWTAAEA